MRTLRTTCLVTGLIVMASPAIAQGPGAPLGGVKTGLSKEPRPIAALGMNGDEINRGLGAPNSVPRSAGFTVTSVSTVPLANESIWEYSLKVSTPYAWNGQGAWIADSNRMGEVRVFRHIGFDKSGKAVIDVMRVMNKLGQGVEMTSAIRGLSEKGEMLDRMEVYAEDPNGTNAATLSSLANATGIAQTTPVTGDKGGGLAVQGGQTGGFPSGMGDARFAFVRGFASNQPVFVLSRAWDVNPVGALGPHVPNTISPLIWSGAAPVTGGKGGGIAVQAGTVPGVDIIIKKCPCGSLPAGSVGVVTNVSIIAVGAFDERKLREVAKRSMEARGGK